MINKCKYFNNHHTACCLMIDDLVPVIVSIDGIFGPNNDWGYLMDHSNSVYSYFNDFVLKKYPEIRGTIFFPIESYLNLSVDKGYTIMSSELNEEYLNFLHRISDKFEIQFHGIYHTCYDGINTSFEFENITKEELIAKRNKLLEFHSKGLVFKGGKFPGYKYNDTALEFLDIMCFRWMAFDYNMMNKKHRKNKTSYFKNTNIVDIPTNISGDVFNYRILNGSFAKQWIKRSISLLRNANPVKHLQYLYQYQYPITIQEHFQNQRTDGKRQKPNIFDDINSIDRIYSFLRPLDIWHTTCSKLAHYFDSYSKTLIYYHKDSFDIDYKGNWDCMYLSFKSRFPQFKEKNTGNTIHGLLKNGEYIFNNLQAGTYIL